MDIIALATRGYLSSGRGAIVIGPAPEIIDAFSDIPAVVGSQKAAELRPAVSGSSKAKPSIRKSTGPAAPGVAGKPSIVGSKENKPAMRKRK